MIELNSKQMMQLIDDIVTSAAREISFSTKYGNPLTLKVVEVKVGGETK